MKLKFSSDREVTEFRLTTKNKIVFVNHTTNEVTITGAPQ